jgi:hypothetical protein
MRKREETFWGKKTYNTLTEEDNGFSQMGRDIQQRVQPDLPFVTVFAHSLTLIHAKTAPIRLTPDQAAQVNPMLYGP